MTDTDMQLEEALDEFGESLLGEPNYVGKAIRHSEAREAIRKLFKQQQDALAGAVRALRLARTILEEHGIKVNVTKKGV